MPRNRKKKRQKIGVKTCGDPNKGHVAGKRPVGYSDIIKENASFERYYKEQHIVPEEEWEMFMAALRDNLPTAFRITGYRGQANALLKVIQGQYFQDLLNVNVEEEEYTKPYCLPWYPDNLAWQLKLSRVIIRKSEEFSRLHNFLVSETESGNISRQETVSMIPPLLLDIKPYHKILDMCAAPGSKTAQVIEMLHKEEGMIPDGVVVANDVDNKRCYMLVHQAKRLHSPCFIITNHDASQMPNIKINKNGIETFLKYDRILCDVPCSGDGTIRKNIDVWRKWNVGNGNNLHGLQFRIAKRGLELLALNGIMVYSTCSLNPIEDEAVIASLLQQSNDSVELVDTSESLPGLKTSPGLSYWKVMNRELESFDSFDDVPDKYRTQIRPQMFPPAPEIVSKLNLHRCLRILPHHQNTGGFFIAVFKKVKEFLPWESQIKEIVSHKNNDIEEKLSDVIETKDESDKSPPRKKKKIWGYKEDPYIFFKDEGIIWPNIRDFYKLDSFPYKQLLSRCAGERKKNLYFVSEAAKNIVQNNIDFVKIINTGVRVFCRSDNKDAKCNFRLSQEGVPIILPFMEGRILHISLEDLILLLTEEVPLLQKFSDELQKQAALLDSGCAVMIYTANKGTKEEFKIELCGWKGKASVRCYVTKIERIHYLRICGVDVSEFEKKDKKFKIYITKTSEFTEEEDQKNIEKAKDTDNSI
ncbi:RNA cytosine-C(5)-methyltransferase NSUN2 [Centruroides vittatus]|uniref:RNA cytosine-C(5)-methyltransferase NSUN2 n=1 Tax=Centruroides vittatus TaxID=120091 RepID=UPI00350F777D